MKKILESKKQKIVAGYRTKRLSLFNKVMITSMLTESINGVLNLINQGIYYSKSGNYKNQPNHYYSSSPRFFYKLGAYPSTSTLNISSPLF